MSNSNPTQPALPYDEDGELKRLYTAITGRPGFSYAPSSDPMYRSYADRYIQNGRLAMRDTMGQAAALTGGYGSSYAQSVGQQQYNEYLRSLGEVLPELYGLAWQRYSAEGEQLQNAYDLAWQRRENEYQRGRDALSDERYAAEQELERQRWDAQQAAAAEKPPISARATPISGSISSFPPAATSPRMRSWRRRASPGSRPRPCATSICAPTSSCPARAAAEAAAMPAAARARRQDRGQDHGQTRPAAFWAARCWGPSLASRRRAAPAPRPRPPRQTPPSPPARPANAM